MSVGTPIRASVLLIGCPGLIPVDLAILVEDYWLQNELELIPLAIDLMKVDALTPCLSVLARYRSRFRWPFSVTKYLEYAGRTALYYRFYASFDVLVLHEPSLASVAKQSCLIAPELIARKPLVCLFTRRHWDKDDEFAIPISCIWEAQSQLIPLGDPSLVGECAHQLLDWIDTRMIATHPHVYAHLVSIFSRERVILMLESITTMAEGKNLESIGLASLWLAQWFSIPVAICNQHSHVGIGCPLGRSKTPENPCPTCRRLAREIKVCAERGCTKPAGEGHRYYHTEGLCADHDYARWYKEYGRYNSGFGPN